MTRNRRWPHPDRREAIPGGAIIPGPCGRPHLRGGAYTWWRCPVCADLRYRVCPDCTHMADLANKIRST